MGAQKIKLTVNSYFEEELELTFPASWEVVECRMAGHDKPALTDEEMRAAVRNPIGGPRLKDLASGRQEVVILFDDVTKPTPTGRIASFVL